MTKLDNETGTLTGEEADARWKEISSEVELIWSAVFLTPDQGRYPHRDISLWRTHPGALTCSFVHRSGDW
jgi:hypothetical protein